MLNAFLAKAKQKGLKKVSHNKSVVIVERLGFDISYLRNASFGGSKYWLLIVDEFSNMKLSLFLRRKADAIRDVVDFVKNMKAGNQEMVTFLRYNNSGENEGIRKILEKDGVTSPNRPQENGRLKGHLLPCGEEHEQC